MKLQPVLAICIVFFFSGCKKDGRGCWQAFVPQGFGYDAPGLVLCDKTKAEAEAAYPQYWFYRQGETKFCWTVQVAGRTYHTWGIPQSMADRQMQENAAYRFSKVDCASFCAIEWHEKSKGKITGQFAPVRLVTETIFSADSCSRLSIGRVVIMRETADSLITRELVKKFP